MTREQLKNLIDVAAGRKRADLVIKNGRIADVFRSTLIDADVAITDGIIAGLGSYEGEETYDAKGRIILPGLIDSHIHIESSYMTPEEFGRLVLPTGTTTVIADPHEIVNVCGTAGLDYMLSAAENTPLDIRFMVPGCVPATPFETNGATLDSEAIRSIFESRKVLGLGEFMDFPGVCAGDDECVGKLLAAKNPGLPIDGHAPRLSGNALNAYIASGILTDHECSEPEEMQEKLSRGMYILLRHGSACRDLERLLPGVNPSSMRRLLLCSDDRQIHTIKEEGHVDSLLRICVKNGIDPFDALRMATLNAAECYSLKELGSVSPGKRANLVLVDDLKEFRAVAVFVNGRREAENGVSLTPVNRADASMVSSSVNVKDFNASRLKLSLSSDCVKVIDILPDGVLTGNGRERVRLDNKGDFIYDEEKDIVKIAVIERHKGTGNVGVALLRGYGIKKGAVALSVSHDSHNIIAAGTSDGEIAAAVEEIIRMKGGMTLIRDGKARISIPLPVAGLMSSGKAEDFDSQLKRAHEIAHKEFHIHEGVEPFMTLCFMALPVIPELKLTDRGLFDVTKQSFTPVEA